MAFPTNIDADKYFGFYWGSVLRNDDPERRGRVRTEVPGMFQDLKWAVPIGMPGAGGRPPGYYSAPPVGAQVIIGFIQGDREEPFYLCGPPALTEAPSEVYADDISVKDAPNVTAIETNNFEVVIVDTETRQQVRIGSKDLENVIEIDLKDGSLYFKAKHFIIFDAPLFSIEQRGKIQIGGRIVMPIGPPI